LLFVPRDPERPADPMISGSKKCAQKNLAYIGLLEAIGNKHAL